MIQFKKIVLLFVIWKIWLWSIAFIGLAIFQQPFNRGFIDVWTNWDGRHLIAIAEIGYQVNYQFAFFPIYPAAIKTVSLLTQNYNLSAIIISNLSLLGFLILFYQWAKSRWQESIATYSVLAILFFPTSFYLNAAYSESLYLLLSITTFILAEQRHWTRSWMAAMLSMLARFTGIVNGLYVVAIYAKHKPLPKVLLIFLLSFSGLLLYMLYLKLHYDNPVWFIDAQSHWQRQTSLTNPISTVLDYPALLGPTGTPTYAIYLDYIFTALFVILIVYLFRRVDKLLGLYTLLILLFPLLTGSLQSMPRYILAAFPLFIVIGIWGQKRWFWVSWLTASIALQAILTFLYINNFWVA